MTFVEACFCVMKWNVVALAVIAGPGFPLSSWVQFQTFMFRFWTVGLSFESLLVHVGRQSELIAAAGELRLPMQTLSTYVVSGEPKNLVESFRWLRSYVARAEAELEAELADAPKAAKLLRRIASCMLDAKGMPIQMTDDECVAVLRREARDKQTRKDETQELPTCFQQRFSQQLVKYVEGKMAWDDSFRRHIFPDTGRNWIETQMSLHQCWLGFQASKTRFKQWVGHFGFVFDSYRGEINEACKQETPWTFIVADFVGEEMSMFHAAFLLGKRSFEDLLAMVARQDEFKKAHGTTKLPPQLQIWVNHFVELGEGREVLEEAVKRMHRMRSRIMVGFPEAERVIQERFEHEFQEAVVDTIGEDECVSSLRALAADRVARRERVNSLPMAVRHARLVDMGRYVDAKQDWSQRSSYGKSLEDFVQRYTDRKQHVWELISHFNLNVRVDDYRVEETCMGYADMPFFGQGRRSRRRESVFERQTVFERCIRPVQSDEGCS